MKVQCWSTTKKPKQNNHYTSIRAQTTCFDFLYWLRTRYSALMQRSPCLESGFCGASMWHVFASADYHVLVACCS